MNSIMSDYYPLFRLYQRMREQVLDVLRDEDLAFQPGGDNVPLGVLCRGIGETEQCYIDSFKSFQLDFSYRYPNPDVDKSTVALRDWFQRLDQELEQAIAALSEEDIQNRLVDRGGDFRIRPNINLMIYQEALLIFYGKVSVYLKTLGKTPSEQWQHWIA
jgi:hypothetical protein